MKQFLSTDVGTYTFNRTNRTVTFAGITLTHKQVLMVINATRSVIMYNPSNPALGGTFAANVLTLAFDTTAYADTDQLIIVIDVAPADAAAMKVSGVLTNTELRASAVPVSGPLTDAQLRAAAINVAMATNAPDVTDRAARLLGIVTGPLTDTQLRASALAVTGPLTDAQLRATAVPVSGTFFPATQPVSLATNTPDVTDRANRVLGVVTGPATNAELRATALPVSGPLTDAQLRAAALAVTGTFWQATQPVSLATNTPDVTDRPARALGVVTGPLTNTELRASAVPVSVAAVSALFRGRVGSFRTPGRAGTAGQRLAAIFNAVGSTVAVDAKLFGVDVYQTVAKAIGTAPPIIRIWKIVAAPTGGTAMTKNKIGGTGASSGSVTILQDASADGTLSAAVIAATHPAGAIVTQEIAPRFITAAGYEMADRVELLRDTDVRLVAGEGLVVFLDYTATGSNPATDMWTTTFEWTET